MLRYLRKLNRWIRRCRCRRPNSTQPKLRFDIEIWWLRSASNWVLKLFVSVCVCEFMHKWDATTDGRFNALLLLLPLLLFIRGSRCVCVCVSFFCFDFVQLALLKLSAFYMEWRDTAFVSVALVLFNCCFCFFFSGGYFSIPFVPMCVCLCTQNVWIFQVKWIQKWTIAKNKP